jgi:hypothetical protein
MYSNYIFNYLDGRIKNNETEHTIHPGYSDYWSSPSTDNIIGEGGNQGLDVDPGDAGIARAI